MRHSKTTKAMALMLSLVMITSVFVGNTLSRYVTSVSSTDSARVAVWGINGGETSMELFKTDYEADGRLIAKSNNGDKIIAPGLSGKSAFSIVNHEQNIAPETAYQVKIELDDSEISDSIKNNPSIQWKLDNNAWGTWDELKNSILQLSGDTTELVISDKLEKDFKVYDFAYDENGEISKVFVVKNEQLILYDIDDVIEIWEDGEGRYYVKIMDSDILSSSSGIKIYNPGEFIEAFKNNEEHVIAWQWVMDNGKNVTDTKMGNGDIVEKRIGTGVKDDEGNEIYEIVEEKIQSSVKLKINITAQQIPGSVCNATWQFNDTISGISETFEYFNFEEQTGWDEFPVNTIVKSDNLEFEINGLSKQFVLGIDVLTTIASSGYTIAYIPENNLGLPFGWYEIPEEITELIISGDIGPDNMMEVLSKLISINAPTITFPKQATDALQKETFVKWMSDNADIVE